MNSILYEFHESKMILREIEYSSLMWHNDEWLGCPFLGITHKPLEHCAQLLINDINNHLYMIEIHEHGLGLMLMSNSKRKQICMHLFNWKDLVD